MTHDSHSPEQKTCCGSSSHAPTPAADNGCSCGCKTCRKPRYWLWILGFALFYVVSAAPLGLLAYTVKNTFDLNVFQYGGYHAYLSCIRESFYIDKYRREF
ncbi:MAG: hypothetical protein DI628_01955 [Blastochloris viridis]|uniref:Uncharacterized protein n=1 Tax=Blastochloris viridis TaxID=1079 RepID=A0A6N4RDN3_BLAVI|nr:MAG: hypothetical protein DI628_01955 [Blastochloris viridis]